MPRKKSEKDAEKKIKEGKSPSTLPVTLDAPSNLPVPTGLPETLQQYLMTIRRHPLLSPEKEFEVAKRYFDGHDNEAAQLLVISNLRLVVKIAYDYIRTGIQILDLIQEGNIGLLQAVKEFNPYKGVKFSSYASYWIKAYIRSFILRNWSMVKMGTTRAQRTLFYKLQKEKAKMEALGINPQPKLLAEKLNVKEKEVEEMSQRLSGRDFSLNAPIKADESDGEGWLQFLKDDSEPIDNELSNRELHEEFVERLNAFERTLAGKELLIFRERMRSDEPKTLQEIGDNYGVTRERVRQIEARIMEKLKDYMKKNARFSEQIIDVK